MIKFILLLIFAVASIPLSADTMTSGVQLSVLNAEVDISCDSTCDVVRHERPVTVTGEHALTEQVVKYSVGIDREAPGHSTAYVVEAEHEVGWQS